MAGDKSFFSIPARENSGLVVATSSTVEDVLEARQAQAVQEERMNKAVIFERFNTSLDTLKRESTASQVDVQAKTSTIISAPSFSYQFRRGSTSRPSSSADMNMNRPGSVASVRSIMKGPSSPTRESVSPSVSFHLPAEGDEERGGEEDIDRLSIASPSGWSEGSSAGEEEVELSLATRARIAGVSEEELEAQLEEGEEEEVEDREKGEECSQHEVGEGSGDHFRQWNREDVLPDLSTTPPTAGAGRGTKRVEKVGMQTPAMPRQGMERTTSSSNSGSAEYVPISHSSTPPIAIPFSTASGGGTSGGKLGRWSTSSTTVTGKEKYAHASEGGDAARDSTSIRYFPSDVDEQEMRKSKSWWAAADRSSKSFTSGQPPSTPSASTSPPVGGRGKAGEEEMGRHGRKSLPSLRVGTGAGSVKGRENIAVLPASPSLAQPLPWASPSSNHSSAMSPLSSSASPSFPHPLPSTSEFIAEEDEKEAGGEVGVGAAVRRRQRPTRRRNRTRSRQSSDSGGSSVDVVHDLPSRLSTGSKSGSRGEARGGDVYVGGSREIADVDELRQSVVEVGKRLKLEAVESFVNGDIAAEDIVKERLRRGDSGEPTLTTGHLEGGVGEIRGREGLITNESSLNSLTSSEPQYYSGQYTALARRELPPVREDLPAAVSTLPSFDEYVEKSREYAAATADAHHAIDTALGSVVGDVRHRTSNPDAKLYARLDRSVIEGRSYFNSDEVAEEKESKEEETVTASVSVKHELSVATSGGEESKGGIEGQNSIESYRSVLSTTAVAVAQEKTNVSGTTEKSGGIVSKSGQASYSEERAGEAGEVEAREDDPLLDVSATVAAPMKGLASAAVAKLVGNTNLEAQGVTWNSELDELSDEKEGEGRSDGWRQSRRGTTGGSSGSEGDLKGAVEASESLSGTKGEVGKVGGRGSGKLLPPPSPLHTTSSAYTVHGSADGRRQAVLDRAESKSGLEEDSVSDESGEERRSTAEEGEQGYLVPFAHTLQEYSYAIPNEIKKVQKKGRGMRANLLAVKEHANLIANAEERILYDVGLNR
uniref:Uncharacterized protein n=1 Tax=Palpitomonas bilix TaxID=652834 RepID=A0A7S3GIM9_9EUKA|mmetsp:Transcript_5226/g.11618  ORF Transcript_5226/g.11618 Transcript_5226/m.11618 type:complete len:1050 (+) Transcript_5226:86-3235(+)